MNNLSRLILFLYLLVGFNVQAQFFDWAKTPEHSTKNAFYTDSHEGTNGSFYVTGKFQDTLVIGTDTLKSFPSSFRTYLVKYDSIGNPIWTLQSNSSQIAHHEVEAMDVDDSGNVYLTGFYWDTISFGAITASAQGNPTFFLVKINSSGTPIWIRTNGGSGYVSSEAVVVDQAQNVYVAGDYLDTISFGGLNLPLSNYYDAFLVKYSPSGTPLWVKGFEDPWIGFRPYKLAINSSDDIFMAGHYSDSIHIDTITLVPPGPDEHYFLARFNTNGDVVWAHTIGNDSSFIDIKDIIAAPNGKLGLCGSFGNNLDLGGITLSSTLNNIHEVFIAQYNTDGTVDWADHAGGLGQDFGQAITYDPAGNMYLTGRMNLDLQFGNLNPLLTNNNQFNDVFLAKYSSSGTPEWAIKAEGGPYNVGDGLVYTQQDRLYLLGNYKDSVTIAFSTFHSASPINTEFFVSSILLDANKLSGSLFRDLNHNGVKDIGEDRIPGHWVAVLDSMSNPLNQLTQSNLDYEIYLNSGDFDATISFPPLYHITTPDTQTISFNGIGQSAPGTNFAAAPIAGVQDLEVIITQRQRARIGDTTIYKIQYTNVGTDTVQNCQIVLDYVDSLIYHQSIPSGTLGAGILTWNLGTLPPWTSSIVEAYFAVPMSTPIGTKLETFVEITPIIGDTTEYDNKDSLRQVARLSYDPNDKQVSHDTLTPEQISKQPWLIYTIRFQNTGNDTAYDVVIEDTLSPFVEPRTLQAMHSSHNYRLELNGTNNTKWVFKDIYLPDSNVNEPESNGYITYRVKPKPTVQLGDEILNTAFIYFDFNPPIITNTTITRVDTFIINDTIDFILPIEGKEFNFLIYPNPNRGEFQLQVDGQSSMNLDISIFNSLGATVSNQRIVLQPGRQTIPVSAKGFGDGVYFMVIRTDSGETISKRLIIQK